MKYANRIKPEIQEKILAKVAEKLKDFEPTNLVSSRGYYNPSKGVSEFYFSMELLQADWRASPVYDPNDWNDILRIDPPCRGVYRVKLDFNGGALGSGDQLGYWNGEKWLTGIEGVELLPEDVDVSGAFRDIEIKYLEGV